MRRKHCMLIHEMETTSGTMKDIEAGIRICYDTPTLHLITPEQSLEKLPNQTISLEALYNFHGSLTYSHTLALLS